MQLEEAWNGAWALTSDNWSAIGTWAAVGVALVAAFFALRQVREARISRDEQSQPNVVMFAEPMQADWQFLELVIKNYGQTPAYDVEVSLDTTPEMSPDYEGVGITKVAIPDRIPILAPGQEWRAMWDHAPDHFDADGIKSLHEGVIKYRGERKKSQHWYTPWSKDYARHESPVLLDFELLKGTHRVDIKTTHDIAKTLEAELTAANKSLAHMSKTLHGFTVSEHAGIWVYPIDAAEELATRAEQQRQKRERSQRNRERLDLLGGQRPRVPSPEPAPTDQTDSPHSTEPTDQTPEVPSQQNGGPQ